MPTILVTGGCGFIGSNFVRRCLDALPDRRIVNLDKLTYAGNPRNLADLEGHPRYRFVRGDICDGPLLAELFREEGIDTVVHFAAESHVDRSIEGPDAFVRTNILGTFALLEAARAAWPAPSSPVTRHPSPVTGQPEPACGRTDSVTSHPSPVTRHPSPVRRFLHVSTDEVYGSLGETGFFTEETAYDPRSPYAASKASSDHLASAYFHTYGLPVLITNCSNNYGPYQFPEKLIPLMIHNALTGAELPVYGDGANVRDWLYVEDHCEAVLRVLEAGAPGQTYNIGGNNERRNLEIVQAVCDLVDERAAPLPNGRPRRSLIRFVKDRPGHDRRYAIDAAKIRDELGWVPRVRFEEGLRRTVDWYLANRTWTEAVMDGSYREYYRKMYGDRG